MLNPLKKILLSFQKVEDFFKTRKLIKPTKTTKIIISVVAIALIVFLIYFFGVIKPTCYNQDCFNQKFESCSPAKYTKLRNNNIYQYETSRSLGSTCKLQITMEKTAPGTDLDIKESIERKSMKCYVPKHLTNMDIDGFENLIDHCSGPLKEGMYELMLKRMYGLVVTQMGDIIQEVQKTI